MLSGLQANYGRRRDETDKFFIVLFCLFPKNLSLKVENSLNDSFYLNYLCVPWRRLFFG